MTEKTYTIVVDEGNGHRYKIHSQPESTVRELGLLPQPRPVQIREMDDPEYAASKNIFGDIQVEKVAQIKKKEAPHKDEMVIVSRNRMGDFKGVN